MNDVEKGLSNLFKKELDDVNSINDYAIEVGVISSDNKRKETMKFSIKNDINNAELMFIHEHGSPLHNLPSRPVLQMTIDYASKNLLNKTIDRCFEGIMYNDWNKEDVKKEFEKMCIVMENYARDLIYSNDGRLTANAAFTIKKKGENHPLFDTGQLARSITCRLIKRRLYSNKKINYNKHKI